MELVDCEEAYDVGTTARELSSSGFAVVFAAYDSANRWYALKRQLTKDRESVDAVLLEIRILKELTGHPAILEFIAAAQMKIPSGGVEFLILTELCSGGSVADLMKNVRLTPEEALKIFHAAAMAIENLLFDSSGHVKLCDFGSATTEIYAPDETWNMAKRTRLEEEMQRHTTPMYRAPEILDTYQNFVVGPQQDIWALGCVLFYLCYHVHPFEDSAKLRILNVAYSVPPGSDEFVDILPVIESCLKANPLDRPTARDLVERSEALGVAFGIDFTKPISNVHVKRVQTQRAASGAPSHVPPPRPPPPRVSMMPDEVTEQASAMFGALKGQGLSLLKNLKDRSSAVVQKVQAKLVSQEVTWVTSRICVVPVTSATLEQCDDEEWSSRVASSGRAFAVYNLTSKSLHANYSIEPIACALRSVHPNVPPTIDSVLKLPMSRPMLLRSIALSTLPILAGIRSGLRPVIEVFVGASKVWDSVDSKRLDLRQYELIWWCCVLKWGTC
ncbi:kinase domain protein [Teladorsagia circumcincta]|uniref:Kinase domain protein n=1 Tax=Teladorsagia circumcincta TaxID=45464 RepID=A0A2G9ULT0_TELCI|nr:kinase domain protein [Teladorsagia circumcincta]